MQYVRLPEREDGIRMDERRTPPSKSLYISHFISTWNSRGFEFGAILFLSKIYPDTLLPMSVYALLRALAAITMSPVVGRYIDRNNRLAVVRNSILGQRLAVALSCAGFLGLLLFNRAVPGTVQHIVFALLALLACVEKLCIIMNTIAVERDWVVVIAGEDEALLQEMNSQMRRIDLFCKLISPLAIALLDGISSTIAIVITLAVNSTSVLAEYFLIAWVYRKSPNLSLSSTRDDSSPGLQDEDAADGPPLITRNLMAPLQQWKLYMKSHAFLPSLALSILYLTVLSFSGQMVTYLFALDQPHLTSMHIGLMRTVSTVLEISSTFIAPLLVKHVGAVRAGIWSLSWQFLCLTPGVLTFWTNIVPSPSAATYLFVASVILSRIGLWSFDLTTQLLVQNSISTDQRGSFSATESSLQNLFELCAFAMTIVWSKPQEFKYPATVSLGAIYVAAACYAGYVRVKRGHLLHMPPCCELVYGYKALPVADENSDYEMAAPTTRP